MNEDYEDYEAKVRELSTEKALTLGAYGESVAAYRYRTLCEQATSAAHAQIFTEMADEEKGHHLLIQSLLKKHFPGSDFVLTPEDKELVIVGSRMLDVSDRASFERALELIAASERLTGGFYAALHKITDHTELKPVLKEMAEECLDHAKRLAEIPPLD